LAIGFEFMFLEIKHNPSERVFNTEFCGFVETEKVKNKYSYY